MTVSRATKRRRAHSREWHEAQLAAGPSGFIRDRGADTWERLQQMCREFTESWERLPERHRLAYAFPNPEDRRPAARR